MQLGGGFGPAPLARLSVSSVGSEAMQLQQVVEEFADTIDFQYPRSDRRRCNLAFVPDLPGRVVLFQYPRSDRRRCNDSAGISPRVVSAFQYPRSDRRRCNRRVASGPPLAPGAFSILGRIGGDATILTLERADQKFAFQYPRSDRRRCNSQISPWRVCARRCFQYPRSDRRRCNQPGAPDLR